MVLLRNDKRSSIPVGAPHSGLWLQYTIQRSILPFFSALLLFDGLPQSPPHPRLGGHLFHSTLFSSLSCRRCKACMGCSAGLALLNPHRRSLAWISDSQFHSALLYHRQHSPCPPRTPHQVPLLPWERTSSSPKFIILPFKLHFDSPQANLNSKPFRYHKWNQTTLESNFTHSAGPNHWGIHGAPSSCLLHWWIVCSCICPPRWDGGFRGWHWDNVQ